MEKFHRLCKLCRNKISDDNFKVIDDAIEYIFGLLLLKSTFDRETQCVVCTDCSQKSLAAFNFKSTCLYVDNTIVPYVDFEHPVPIDLKEIHAKENESKERCNMLNHLEICRLCLQPIGSKQRSIQEVPNDSILMYIPEINFTLTTNPVICEICYDSLCVHSTFIKNLSNLEGKINSNDASNNSCIKIEAIEIKSEKTDEEEVPIEIPYTKIKKEEDEEEKFCLHSANGLMDMEKPKIEHDLDDLTSNKTIPIYEGTKSTVTPFQSRITSHQLSDRNTSKLEVHKDNNSERWKKCPTELGTYKCNECDYKSRRKADFEKHQLIHKDPSEVEMFKCDKCKFVTKYKWSLTKHQFRHDKNLSCRKKPARMYKCDDCDYKSSQKYVLIKHQLIHKDPSKVPTYSCEECDYKSIRKTNLRQHQLRHKDPSEVKMNKCDECDFQTIDRSNLRAHQVRRHRDRSQVKMYKCNECEYETVENCRLKKHILRHRAPSEVQMYRCEKCTYETKIKYHLVEHQIKHKNPLEVRMHKCDKCEFETKYRKSYSKHRLMHRDVSQVEVYKCRECQYETKDKRNLMRHQMTHRDPLQLEKYRCGDCDYETVHLSYFRKHQLKHKRHSEVQV